MFALRCGGGGRGDGITANLFIRFHYRQERGIAARVYVLSWCGVSSKLDAVLQRMSKTACLANFIVGFCSTKRFPDIWLANGVFLRIQP